MKGAAYTLPFALMIAPVLLSAGGEPSGGASGPGPEAETPGKAKDPDGVRILYRADFEEGMDGWKREEWEQYKPWNNVELTSEDTFRKSRHSLKTTVPNHWNCLGPVRDLEFRDDDTKVSFAYFGRYCNSINVQCWNVDQDTNMHFTVKPYVEGEWTTGTVEVARFTTWGGAGPPAGGGLFRTFMIFAGCRKEFAEPYLLIDNVVVYSGADTSPPAPPRWHKASINWDEGTVELEWQVPEDNVGVARFHVFRSVSGEFEPSSGNRLGSVPGVDFADDSIANFGVFYYRLIAEDFAGNRSESSQPLAVDVVEKE